MEIITKSRRVTDVSFTLGYRYNDEFGGGFGFPCDEQGNVLPMNDAAAENYRKCITGEFDVTLTGVERWVNTYTVPAVGRCVCRAKVTLFGFTNTCDKCGRDYNRSGQLLAPRSQWGEETGEHWSDIMNIG